MIYLYLFLFYLFVLNFSKYYLKNEMLFKNITGDNIMKAKRLQFHIRNFNKKTFQILYTIMEHVVITLLITSTTSQRSFSVMMRKIITYFHSIQVTKIGLVAY